MLSVQAGRERESRFWLGEASSLWWSEPWVPSEVQQAGILMKELFKRSFLPSVSRILLTFKAKLYFVPLGSSNILLSFTGESGKQLLTLYSPISRPFWGSSVFANHAKQLSGALCSGTP